MINKKCRLFLILMAITPLLLFGCSQTQSDNEPIPDTIAIEPEPELEIIEPEPEPVSIPVVNRPATKAAPAKEEVLYISGHGANGRVWGHITMKGDKGKGSVTDERENALAVTCTRHGEELICYDQNSRQYIFKL